MPGRAKQSRGILSCKGEILFGVWCALSCSWSLWQPQGRNACRAYLSCSGRGGNPHRRVTAVSSVLITSVKAPDDPCSLQGSVLGLSRLNHYHLSRLVERIREPVTIIKSLSTLDSYPRQLHCSHLFVWYGYSRRHGTLTEASMGSTRESLRACHASCIDSLHTCLHLYVRAWGYVGRYLLHRHIVSGPPRLAGRCISGIALWGKESNMTPKLVF